MRPYYDEDGITIFLGDCREILPSITADVVVTDPPYGVAWSTKDTRGKYGVRRFGCEFPPIAGDDAPFDPSIVLDLGLPTAMFGANHYADKLPPSAAWIVWDKRDGMASVDQSDCELCWTNVGGAARMIRYQFNGGLALAKENGIATGRGVPVGLHPTQKPVVVMSHVIRHMPEGSVLDPYMGSGTTLVASKNLGRKAIGIEIEEKYCEIAVKRLAQRILL